MEWMLTESLLAASARSSEIMPSRQRAPRRLRLWFKHLVEILGQAWDRRQAAAQLEATDDRLLRDIGISRTKIYPAVLHGRGRYAVRTRVCR